MILWRPGIGDPTPIGWLIAVAYVLAGAGAIGVARTGASQLEYRSPSALRRFRREAAFWYGVGGLLLLLGFNKQLDMQSLFQELARLFARRFDLYGHRDLYRRDFVLAIGAAAAILLAAILIRFRRADRWIKLAIAGLAVLALFILLRAAQINHLDAGPVQGAPLELGGIAIVAYAARRFRRRRKMAADAVRLASAAPPA